MALCGVSNKRTLENFRCLAAAEVQGLTNVRLGNIHLLGEYYQVRGYRE